MGLGKGVQPGSLKMTGKVYDYTIEYPQGTPKQARTESYIGDIFLNQAVCRQCGDLVRSKNRHHFATCSCGEISVDGGSHYRKRAAMNLDNIIECSVMYRD